MTTIFQQNEAVHIVQRLWKLTNLSNIEKEVVRRHYGFAPYARTSQSFEDISEYMGLSVKDVKTLHNRALKELRKTVKENEITWKGFAL